MKYLLYELHLAQNMDGTNDEELDKLDNQWMENTKRYSIHYLIDCLKIFLIVLTLGGFTIID